MENFDKVFALCDGVVRGANSEKEENYESESFSKTQNLRVPDYPAQGENLRH
jgi:hypothetical protein